MKKAFFATVSLLAVSLAGCASLDALMQPSAQVENTTGVQPLLPYSGPKARIAVADFDVKAAKAGGDIGTGLREILVTALINSNRFSVVERQVLGEVMQEQEPGASGASQQGLGGAQRGKIKVADLIITAAVTEFEPQASGGRAGIGGGGGVGSGELGGLLSTSLNKAHMVLDIRIVDASTSEILAATRVQGQAADISGIGFLGSWALGGGLSAYANIPMEKAIRVCIIEAVRYISQTVPANFYKY